jgi:hypothetical protein
MEDFIYILIGIIWLVFSVIKGTQKKKATSADQHSETSQKEKGRTFEDIMSEILGEDRQTEYVEVSEQESTIDLETAEPEVGSAYQSLEDIYLKEQQERLKNIEILEEEPVELSSEPQFSEESSIHSSFDLRKAIIYQALLERPYA